MSWYIDKVWLLNQISLAQLKKKQQIFFYYNKFIIYLCIKRNNGGHYTDNFRQQHKPTKNKG